MSFDDSTGGIDRAQYASTTDIWGDAWGDRSVSCLWDSRKASLERDALDRIARREYLARQAAIIARNEADATRRRSAPKEAAIKADLLRNAKTSMGAAFRDAYAKQGQGKKGREKALE